VSDTLAPKRLWINAGEASGDMYGALLARAVMRLAPGSAVLGMGGPAMAEAGCELLHSMRAISLVGGAEVLAHLPRLARLLLTIRGQLRERKPDALVLIDTPDFNFMLARMARRQGIPVYFYVSPQVWAWRTGRVRFLRAHARRLICILPFEREFYKSHGMDVEFLGHPLLDQAPIEALRGLPKQEGKVTILPGSRRKEISSLLGEFCGAAALMLARRPELRFTVVRAPGVDEALLREHVPASLPVEFVGPEARYEHIAASRLVLAASGTVTLECALLGTPAVVAYKLSPLSYALGRLIIDVPFISLPNLILGEQVFPELLQSEATAQNIASHAQAWLDDPAALARVTDRLGGLARLMGGAGASERVARLILADLAG